MIRKKTNNKTNRRDFLKKTSLLSTFLIVPRHVLGGVNYLAPSDQLAIAAIGAGGKGQSDILHASANGKERVIALCDVDSGDIVKKSRERFPKAKFYEDFRVMLDKHPEIDAVTISTPDHTHANAAINSMERNKHVYVQKPISHNIRETRMMTEMARDKKVVSQMGNQGASNPYQLSIQKWITDDEIGDVHKVYVWTNRPVWPQGVMMPKPDNSKLPNSLNWDLWLGPANKTDYTPGMHPFDWRGWWQYGTGALGDMGCHLIDIPFKALGLKYPTDVECSVGSVFTKKWTPEYIPEGCPPSSSVTLHFNPTSINKNKIEMIWTDGGIRPSHPDIIPSEYNLGGFDGDGKNGIMMIGEKGIISCDEKARDPILFKNDGSITRATLPEGTVNELKEWGHQKKWVDACKAGYKSDEHLSLTSSFDYAGPLTETVLMGNIAIRSYLLRKRINKRWDYFARKKLLWDGINMKITNLDEANQFTTRDYREGWKI